MSALAQLLFGLLLLLTVACTPKPQPRRVPPPPAAEPGMAKPQQVKAGRNDREVNKCVPTKVNKDGSVNCLCASMSTKIDSATGEMSVECKTISPRKEVKSAKKH